MTEYNTSLEIQSKTIDWLRFPLAFLVVALHTSFVSGLVCSDSVDSFLRVVICVLGQLAVPAFFFFSGYLFFSHLTEWDWAQWKRKIVKRCRTLLLPYLLWIILAIFIRFIYDSLKAGDILSLDTFRDFLMSHGGGRIAYDKGPGFVEMSSNLFGWDVAFGKPIDAPLWFIRDLMIISILSPLWFFLLKILKHWWLLLIGIVYVLNLGFPFSGCSLTGVFFFSFGAYFMLYGKLFTEAFYKLRRSIGVIAGALMIAGIIFSGRHSQLSVYLSRFFCIFGVPAVINIASMCVASNKGGWLIKLAETSFFIYAIHAICILDISNFILWRLIPIDSETVYVLKVFLRPMVATAICLGIYYFMKRFMPKTLGLLTGGRG